MTLKPTTTIKTTRKKREHHYRVRIPSHDEGQRKPQRGRKQQQVDEPKLPWPARLCCVVLSVLVLSHGTLRQSPRHTQRAETAPCDWPARLSRRTTRINRRRRVDHPHRWTQPPLDCIRWFGEIQQASQNLSIRHRHRHDFTIESVPESVLFHFQIVTCLQIQPEPFRRSKETC